MENPLSFTGVQYCFICGEFEIMEAVTDIYGVDHCRECMKEYVSPDGTPDAFMQGFEYYVSNGGCGSPYEDKALTKEWEQGEESARMEEMERFR